MPAEPRFQPTFLAGVLFGDCPAEFRALPTRWRLGKTLETWVQPGRPDCRGLTAARPKAILDCVPTAAGHLTSHSLSAPLNNSEPGLQ